MRHLVSVPEMYRHVTASWHKYPHVACLYYADGHPVHEGGHRVVTGWLSQASRDGFVTELTQWGNALLVGCRDEALAIMLRLRFGDEVEWYATI